MAHKLGTIKILLWIGIIIFSYMFIYFTFFPQTDSHNSEADLLYRMFAFLPFCWVVLFFFAQKNVLKNLAIINCAIISFGMVFLLAFIHSYRMGFRLSLEGWINSSVFFVYLVLLFIFKPKAERKV